MRAIGVLENIGVDVGAAGDPHQPVKDALARRGVSISDRTIKLLRSGAIRPAHTAHRLACADRLQANYASLKTYYFLHVLEVGQQHRRPARGSRGVYACLGLSGAMQAALGCSHSDLSRLLRIIRADIALWSESSRDEGVAEEFRKAAALFVRVHHDKNWMAIRGVNDLIRIAWDQHTIHGFYFALCSLAGSLTRAAWLPYELDVLWSFYLRQHKLGDPLTPLDRQVLASAVNRTPTASELSEVVRAHTGVEYHRDCVTTHRNLLVVGARKQGGQGPHPSP